MAKVLVLEDDRLSQKVVGRVLSNAGHEALSADSTQHAWDKLQEHVLVDMVVLDNQLDQEWGWQFLRMLRSSAAYRGLPVIVYSAHNERSAVVRYLELGVQSLHVKPYQSDVILRELNKAVESKWTTKVMEPPDVVCARLGLSIEDYGGLLATATRSIEDSLTIARRRLMTPHDTVLSAALSSIEQQCRTVGINVIDGVIRSIRKSAEEQDINEAYGGLRSVESFLGMIRHRMLSVLKMNGSVARTALTVGSAPTSDGAQETAPVSIASAYSRDIINKPLWQYGGQLKRLMRSPLLTPDELLESTTRVRVTAPFPTVVSTLKLLQSIQSLTVEEAATIARDTRGFSSTYREVLERITGTEQPMDTLPAMSKIVETQGVAKVMTLVAVARVANSLPRGGLLNLRQLFAHTLSASLIAYEIGRLLKLANDFMLSAAGLVHDGGRWLFAIGEPGAYALALALAEDEGITVEQAETALFGIDHQQAGRRLVASLEQPELMQDAASLHHDPSRVTDPESLITVCVIHLAHLLAQAALAGSAVEAKNILTRLRDPAYPVWSKLKSRGVELPFETPELVDTMAAIANTSNWSAFQFIDKA